MAIKNSSKMLSFVLGVFILFGAFSNNTISACKELRRVSDREIDVINNTSENSVLVDFSDPSKYASLYNIIATISKSLKFKCFCGFTCFEIHICDMEKSVTIILKNLRNDKLSKELIEYFEEMIQGEFDNEINVYYSMSE